MRNQACRLTPNAERLTPNAEGSCAGVLPASPVFFPPRTARSSQDPIAEGAETLSPADQALAFRKFAYATRPEPGFWWLQGRRYGLVDNQLTPLWDMHVGIVFRTRDLDGGA